MKINYTEKIKEARIDIMQGNYLFSLTRIREITENISDYIFGESESEIVDYLTSYVNDVFHGDGDLIESIPAAFNELIINLNLDNEIQLVNIESIKIFKPKTNELRRWIDVGGKIIDPRFLNHYKSFEPESFNKLLKNLNVKFEIYKIKNSDKYLLGEKAMMLLFWLGTRGHTEVNNFLNSRRINNLLPNNLTLGGTEGMDTSIDEWFGNEEVFKVTKINRISDVLENPHSTSLPLDILDYMMINLTQTHPGYKYKNEELITVDETKTYMNQNKRDHFSEYLNILRFIIDVSHQNKLGQNMVEHFENSIIDSTAYNSDFYTESFKKTISILEIVNNILFKRNFKDDFEPLKREVFTKSSLLKLIQYLADDNKNKINLNDYLETLRISQIVNSINTRDSKTLFVRKAEYTFPDDYGSKYDELFLFNKGNKFNLNKSIISSIGNYFTSEKEIFINAFIRAGKINTSQIEGIISGEISLKVVYDFEKHRYDGFALVDTSETDEIYKKRKCLISDEINIVEKGDESIIKIHNLNDVKINSKNYPGIEKYFTLPDDKHISTIFRILEDKFKKDREKIKEKYFNTELTEKILYENRKKIISELLSKIKFPNESYNYYEFMILNEKKLENTLNKFDYSKALLEDEKNWDKRWTF